MRASEQKTGFASLPGRERVRRTTSTLPTVLGIAALLVIIATVVWGLVGGTFSSLPFMTSGSSGCGPAPRSNGPHATQVVATVDSPSSVQAGARLLATVTVTNASGQRLRMDSGSPVDLLLLRNDQIVSRYAGPVAGVGWSLYLAPGESAQREGWVEVTDCAADGNLSPGEYLVVAVIDDLPRDGSARLVVVSRAYPITVLG